MNDSIAKIDEVDTRLIIALQKDASLSQRALADEVGLSQNACYRRLQKLTQSGILLGASMRVNPAAIGLSLTVFMMLRTRNHDIKWARRLRQRAESIPEIVELHRVGGEWDYLLKVVTSGIGGYDRVYQNLITDLEFEAVTGIFSMETMLDNRPLPVLKR